MAMRRAFLALAAGMPRKPTRPEGFEAVQLGGLMAPTTAAHSDVIEEVDEFFDLDVTLLEVADPAGLVNLTDDGCTTTCGSCTTGVA